MRLRTHLTWLGLTDSLRGKKKGLRPTATVLPRPHIGRTDDRSVKFACLWVFLVSKNLTLSENQRSRCLLWRGSRVEQILRCLLKVFSRGNGTFGKFQEPSKQTVHTHA